MSNPDEIPPESATDEAASRKVEEEPDDTLPTETEAQKSTTSVVSNASGDTQKSTTSEASKSSKSAHSVISEGTGSAPGSRETSLEGVHSEESISSPSPEALERSEVSGASETSSYRLEHGFQFAAEKVPACYVLYDLTDADLLETFNDLEKNLRRITTENNVFYRFLTHNDPEAFEDMMLTLQPDKTRSTKGSVASSRRGSIFSKSLPRRPSYVTIPQTQLALALHENEKESPKINITQKSDLVTRDFEEFHARMEAKKTKLNKLKRNVKAKLEESATRKDELDKSIKNFELFKETTEGISLQKFVRFMDEWSKRSRLMADKLRLRFSSSRVQYQKLSATLAHKQLIGENLQAIDFENLKVANQHAAEKIEMKTLLLIELKKMTAHGNLKLSQHKQFLQQKIFEKEALEMAIHKVEKDIAKSDDEIVKLYVELDQVKQEHTRIKERYRSYKTPDLMIYVRKKSEVDTLKKDLKAWTKRRSFKEKALEIELNSMKRLLHCKEPHPSWFE